MIATHVLLAVLFAALLHAAWNAAVKAQSDPLIGMAWMSVASGVAAGLAVPLTGVPVAAAWPYLLVSTAIHTIYNLLLAMAYRHGDFSRVYPIARGGAPLMVTFVSLVFLREELGDLALIAIGLILLAIIGVAWRRTTFEATDDRSLLYAGLTACSICAYTIADGLGGRAAGDPIAYAVWLFFLDAWPTIGVVLWLRRGRFLQAPGRGIAQSLTGGLLSMLAYAIVIWAIVHAPVAVVAALRESSILFGALIGLFVLRERPGRVRIAAMVLLAAAVALLRLA